MQQTQIVTYGLSGTVLERLRELASAQRVWLRETSQWNACQNLLANSPTLFVLQLGRDLERELALVEQTHACSPKTAIIIIGDNDNNALSGLGWELGASYVLFPPTLIERITEIASQMLRETPS